MLDADTKRRIDSARDILVGKVPDPKSQVEQVTIALIYKFMDDMDREAEELGGKRKFFTGEFAKYGWSNLMGPGLGGHDMLSLYSDGIQKMPENPGIPTLFRDIFKNAFLPYKDPETLRAFLKVIDEFEYDHSERLGDAFEYLLSILGSQGDAGQFRTPRHIIDFMVEIMNPTKDDVILDPACGTAGFLISAYKHILKTSTDANGHSKLTPEDRQRIAKNIRGYDISPDMVRLSLVNLYLHGFTNPHIYEYDTLTSEDRWNEFADVILANPPFMSPKGGIKPHKRFSIQAKRSEVLFVDYMAEHLSPNGRAAIVVPEGIIFQSQTAYKDLRKMLVEDYLLAVISLPAGVFQPYSGVKTSILVLDRSLAKRSDSIAFFKVENDGFSLGAQRRAIKGSDLSQVIEQLREFTELIRTMSGPFELETSLRVIVPKDKLRATSDFCLSGERFRDRVSVASAYENVPLGEVVDILDSLRRPISKGERKKGPYPYYGATGVVDYVDGFLFDEPLVLVGEDGAKWASGDQTAFSVSGRVWINNHAHVLRPHRNVLLDRFLIEILNAVDLTPYVTGVTVPKLNQEKLRSIPIPLPPLEVQREIVAEIEGYQKVIDGARAVVESYRPRMLIDNNWPKVKLGECFSISSGGTPSKANESYWSGDIPWVSPKDMKSDVIVDTEDHISSEAVASSSTKLFPQNTVVCVVRSGILRHSLPVAILERPMCINQDLVGFQSISGSVLPAFLLYVLKSDSVRILEDGVKPGVTVQSFRSGYFKNYEIPVPPLELQQSLVAELDSEREAVDSNKRLISAMERKIEKVLEQLWVEEV